MVKFLLAENRSILGRLQIQIMVVAQFLQAVLHT